MNMQTTYLDKQKIYLLRNFTSIEIKLYEYLVYMSRLDESILRGGVFSGDPRLQKITGRSRSSVQAYLQKLEKHGLIKRFCDSSRRRLIAITGHALDTDLFNINININNNINNTQNARACEHIYKNNPVNTEYDSTKRNEFENNNISPTCQDVLTDDEKMRLNKIADKYHELTEEINKISKDMNPDFIDRPIAWVRGVGTKLKSLFSCTNSQKNNNKNNRRENVNMNLSNFEDKFKQLWEGYDKHGNEKHSKNALMKHMYDGTIHDNNWGHIIERVTAWMQYWLDKGDLGTQYQTTLHNFLRDKKWEEKIPEIQKKSSQYKKEPTLRDYFAMDRLTKLLYDGGNK